MRFDKQQIAIIVMAVLIIGGFGVFQYYPLFMTAMSNRQARAEGKATSYEISRKASEFGELEAEIKELEPVDEKYANSVPSRPDFAKLWSKITEIMNENNLRDHLVQPGKEERGDKLSCSPLKIECTGTMKQIHGLFASLHKLDRKIRIENVSMTNDKDYSGNVKLVADARIYYQAGQEKTL